MLTADRLTEVQDALDKIHEAAKAVDDIAAREAGDWVPGSPQPREERANVLEEISGKMMTLRDSLERLYS